MFRAKYLLAFLLLPVITFVAIKNCFISKTYKDMPFDIAFIYQMRKFFNHIKEA